MNLRALLGNSHFDRQQSITGLREGLGKQDSIQKTASSSVWNRWNCILTEYSFSREAGVKSYTVPDEIGISGTYSK
jgi:hypothetical protein